MKLFSIIILLISFLLCQIGCSQSNPTTNPSHPVIIAETFESGAKSISYCFYEVPSNLFEIKNKKFSVTSPSSVKLLFPYFLSVRSFHFVEPIKNILAHHPQKRENLLSLWKNIDDLHLTYLTILANQHNSQLDIKTLNQLHKKMSAFPTITPYLKQQFVWIVSSLMDQHSSHKLCSVLPSFLRNWPFPSQLDQKNSLIGIVELPLFFGKAPENGGMGLVPPSKLKPLTLYAQPNKDSAILTTIDNPENLWAAEYGYEKLGAMVSQEKHGWHFVNGSLTQTENEFYLSSDDNTIEVNGWIAPEDVGQFHSLTELFKDGLNYLTSDWNRILYSEPSLSSRFIELDPQLLSDDDDELQINVLDSGLFQDSLWLKIEILQGRCTLKEKSTGIRGWIPAQSASSSPDEYIKMQAWFYSRGC